MTTPITPMYSHLSMGPRQNYSHHPPSLRGWELGVTRDWKHPPVDNSKDHLMPFVAYVCPRCGDRRHVHPATYLVAHHCPKNLTTRGHACWTRYQPTTTDEGDTAE